MTKQILVEMVALAASIGSLAAHHVHPASDWDLNNPVSIEGTVTQIYWGEPHAWFKVLTAEKKEYHMEWTTPRTMARYGIAASPFNEGDRVIFTGVLPRDPKKLVVAMLTEIRRPADGWRWTGWDMPIGNAR